MKCWGRLGLPTGTATAPVAVSGLASGVTVVALGGGIGTLGATCAIQNGALYCWGYGSYSELGDGSREASVKTTPSLVSGLTSGVTSVSIGQAAGYACAIMSGSLYCWGEATYDRLGTKDITETCGRAVPSACSTTPKLVKGISNVTSVAAGHESTCAIAQGAVNCWGANKLGIFGSQ